MLLIKRHCEALCASRRLSSQEAALQQQSPKLASVGRNERLANVDCVASFKTSQRSQHHRALYIQVSGYYKQLSNHYKDFVYIASIHNHIPFCLFGYPLHAHRRIQITGDFKLSLQGGLQDYVSINTFE